jgi:DNA-binding SARP family transcriptional activator/tetratricopeptide (TPR) repeat protein
MEFRILGQVELWAGDKRHEVGTRKARSVLALLLCEPGRPVPAETLVARVWGTQSSDSAAKSLHETISRLRKHLRDAGGASVRLTQRSGSYVLDVDQSDVDAWRFRILADEARAVAARGDYRRAAELFAEADALWHGIPLDGVEGIWAEGVRRRLREDRLNANIESIQARMQLGRHADLVGEIADLAHQDPLNERLLALHLRALYGSGRQAEALAIYHRAEHRRRHEVGGGLGRDLRDLHSLMLHEDPALSAVVPAQRSSDAIITDAAPQPAPPSSMPRDNPDFTGRAAEFATLSSWLASDEAQSSDPVVVIDGMAGVGKTVFAIHAARQLRQAYPEQVFVPLRANDADQDPPKPAIALGRMLRALGVPDSVIPADVEDRADLMRFKLAGRRMLIVLDDAHDERQVRPLLHAVPGCLVIITTRRRTLSLPGTLPLPLDPLPHPDAEALFCRIAGDRIRAQGDQAAISRLVRLCGHVPQWIYFAGQQLRMHSAWRVDDLVSRFSDARSGELNMTALLDPSYGYLTPDQQRLFRWLALHPGDSFSLHAAVAVVGGSSPVITEHALEVLLDYHLIEEPLPGRYEFHAVLRRYAEGLAKSVDTEEDRRLAAGRLLDYYVGLLDHTDQIVRPFARRITLKDVARPTYLPSTRTRRECAELLEAEKTCLLAVARYAGGHGWQHHAALFAHLLSGALDTWGDWADATDLHQRAVEACRAVADGHGEATALIDLGFTLCRTRQLARAEDCLRKALVIARLLGDTACEAAALDTTGIIQASSDRYEESLASHDQALSLWRQLSDRHGEADALSHGALPAARLGRHRDALTRADLALAAYRELGDPHGETNVLNNLGGLQQDAGCHDDALIRYEQAMARFIEIGDRQGEAVALSNIGESRRISGHHDEALKDFRAALSVFGEIGDRGSAAQAINGMAAAFAGAGDSQDALEQYEKALSLATEISERHTQIVSHLGIGGVRLVTGQHLAAADDFRAALRLSQDIADPVSEGRALYGLGRALLHTEGPAVAQEHLLAALALFDASGRPDSEDVRAQLSSFAWTPEGAG